MGRISLDTMIEPITLLRVRAGSKSTKRSRACAIFRSVNTDVTKGEDEEPEQRDGPDVLDRRGGEARPDGDEGVEGRARP